MPLFLALAAIFAGRLSDRSGGRALTVTGMVVVTTTLAVLATSKPGQAMLLVGLALVGTGLGLFTPANNAAIMASAPKDRAGVAAGVLNMARGLGTTLGLALTGLVYGLAPAPRDGFPGRNGAPGRRLGGRPRAGRSRGVKGPTETGAPSTPRYAPLTDRLGFCGPPTRASPLQARGIIRVRA